LDSKPKLAVVAYAIALLTKPQSIALAPLVMYYIIKRYGWEKFVASALTLIATIFVVILPFKWSNPVTFLLNIYSTGYGGYAFNTVNAFNIWAFFGFWIPDTQPFLFLNFFTIGWILFAISVISILFVLHKRLEASGEFLVLFSAFILLFSFFMLLTRIHERYLFPAISVLALLFPFFEKMRPVYYILSFTFFINQAYILYFLNTSQFIPNGDPIVVAFSSINTLVFLYILWLMQTQKYHIAGGQMD
jgi:Gpi18-like mannosyltransferase